MNAQAPISMGQEPPHNIEAEQGLLGAILVNNRAYEKVSEIVNSEEFADPVHGRIFEACGKLIEGGTQANPITLKSQFDQDESLQETGGAQYLVRLAASVVTVINAEDYAHEIHDAFLRRCAIDAARELSADAYCRDGAHTAEDCIQMAQSRLDEIQGVSATSGDLEKIEGAALAVYERAKKVMEEGPGVGGLSTGVSDLDRAIGLMQPGRLYIMGGRPAMGKSALAIAIAENVASSSTKEEPRHVAFFSLEMQSPEIACRLVAKSTGITQTQQEEGPLDHNDVMRIGAAVADIERLHLHIDDTAQRSLAEMRRRAKRLKRRHGLSLLVVDYIQLMGLNRGQRAENRVQVVSEFTSGLKALAKELDVPVIALSQLSRALEQREDKRPVLADLRESGSIEQDADVVMFVFREQYYLEKGEPVQRLDESDDKFHDRCDAWESRLEACRGVLDVLVPKRRSGPSGMARLFCDLSRNKITNLDTHHSAGGF